MAVITYKCPNCGGELKFDPETQKYKCPYCLSVLSQEEADAAAGNGSFSGDGEKSDQAFQNAQTEDADSFEYREDAAQEGREEAVLFTCPSCGAELVTDDTTAATFCYYCHNPVVLSGRLSGDYLPDKIIPFQLTKEKARKTFYPLSANGNLRLLPFFQVIRLKSFRAFIIHTGCAGRPVMEACARRGRRCGSG